MWVASDDDSNWPAAVTVTTVWVTSGDDSNWPAAVTVIAAKAGDANSGDANNRQQSQRATLTSEKQQSQLRGHVNKLTNGDVIIRPAALTVELDWRDAPSCCIAYLSS